MALRKVKPAVKAEEVVKDEAVETVEAEATESTEEVVAETTEAKATPKKATAPKKTETAKKATTPAKKAETKKASEPKKVVKAVKEAKEIEEDGDRATRKNVIRKTKVALEELGLDVSLENLTKIIGAFEEVAIEETNQRSFKFMGGMFKRQKRNAQVFKSPKVDYHSYKAERFVKTFTQDTEQVDKYKGAYNDETKVFHADGKWNYDTQEFEPVDIELSLATEEE